MGAVPNGAVLSPVSTTHTARPNGEQRRSRLPPGPYLNDGGNSDNHVTTGSQAHGRVRLLCGGGVTHGAEIHAMYGTWGLLRLQTATPLLAEICLCLGPCSLGLFFI
ncbi:hypothetical protein ES288_A06G157300v1 [Gossypium darwinii]|uniref:Uncharacterized protein n=1 Tax=Gossypium darwinii TaxID=34276 RepID=A0A5D2G7T6_GOSDA|nr:hypothetical protein ES288_A06G157300v1 [Gossypium darwinii]